MCDSLNLWYYCCGGVAVEEEKRQKTREQTGERGVVLVFLGAVRVQEAPVQNAVQAQDAHGLHTINSSSSRKRGLRSAARRP